MHENVDIFGGTGSLVQRQDSQFDGSPTPVKIILQLRKVVWVIIEETIQPVVVKVICGWRNRSHLQFSPTKPLRLLHFGESLPQPIHTPSYGLWRKDIVVFQFKSTTIFLGFEHQLHN